MLKVILVLSVGLLFIKSQAQLVNDVPKILSTCAEQLNIDVDTRQQFLFEDDTPENARPFGEFMTCTWKEGGIVIKDEIVDKEKLATFHAEVLFGDLDANPIQKMGLWYLVRTCTYPSETIHEEAAVKYKNCVAKLINVLSGPNS